MCGVFLLFFWKKKREKRTSPCSFPPPSSKCQPHLVHRDSSWLWKFAKKQVESFFLFRGKKKRDIKIFSFLDFCWKKKKLLFFVKSVFSCLPCCLQCSCWETDAFDLMIGTCMYTHVWCNNYMYMCTHSFFFPSLSLLIILKRGVTRRKKKKSFFKFFSLARVSFFFCFFSLCSLDWSCALCVCVLCLREMFGFSLSIHTPSSIISPSKRAKDFYGYSLPKEKKLLCLFQPPKKKGEEKKNLWHCILHRCTRTTKQIHQKTYLLLHLSLSPLTLWKTKYFLLSFSPSDLSQSDSFVKR